MTFDESELSDQTRTWSSKQPIEELASEDYTVTTESVLQKTRTTYDPNTDKIVNEIAKGVCSCGKPIDANNFAMCLYGDLVCDTCKRIKYNGRCICRQHTEYYLGSKEETIVLVSIIAGLSMKEIKNASGLSEETIRKARSMLVNREYVKVNSIDLFFSRNKKTESAVGVVKILIETYKEDADFKIFLMRIGLKQNVETESRQE